MSTPAIELLTVDDIAKLYKVEIHTARDKIIKTPGFPDPAPGSTVRSRRWLASDVHAFVTRKPTQARKNPAQSA